MIKTDIKLSLDYSSDDIKAAVCAALPIKKDEIFDVVIIKRSLNLSDKARIHYDVTVGLSLDGEREAGLLKMRKKVGACDISRFKAAKYTPALRPVIAGFGPAGMFAALTLAEAGARPIVIERGEDVDARIKSVGRFFKCGELNEKSNVQFGEGGAGTFSDGKLKVGTKDKYKYRILDELIEGGGSPEILYSTTAHLGTDKLPQIVKHVREKIISLGGEVRFNTTLTDIEIKDGALISVTLDNGTPYKLDANTLILALGHSARDTVKMLYSKGLSIEPKGFGIGLRIEHKRDHINELIYGGGYDSALESASYHLVEHLPSGRNVYSFCMCPGGTVVPSAREAFGVVTNGMSAYARDGENSNAAFLVSVTPKDFGGTALGGFDLQRELEERAYMAGGGGYLAPASRMEDFLKGEKSSRLGDVAPTYPIGVTPTSHDSYLPEYITLSIREAIPKMNDWLPGFYEADAVLTGVETRSTSPIKMLRKECFESAFISGIYPVGEGAGYGGGIISSAYDGMRCADSIINNHKN